MNKVGKGAALGLVAGVLSLTAFGAHGGGAGCVVFLILVSVAGILIRGIAWAIRPAKGTHTRRWTDVVGVHLGVGLGAALGFLVWVYLLDYATIPPITP